MKSRHKRLKTKYGAAKPGLQRDAKGKTINQFKPRVYFKEPGIFLLSQEHIDKSAANINSLEKNPMHPLTIDVLYAGISS